MDGWPSLHLGQPLALLGLLLLPLAARLPRARLRAESVGQRRAILATRLLLLALLALALADPTVGLAGRARNVVFAVDTSDSMGAEQRAWARAWVRQAAQALGPPSHAAVVEFGARAQLGQADASDPPGAPRAADPAGEPPGDATNLEAALRLGASLLPGDGSGEIVLLSDGWENRGHADAPAVVPAGVAVSYAVPPLPAAPEVALQALDVAAAIRVGEAPELTATLESTVHTGAHLRLWLDNRPLADQAVTLEAGTNRFSLSPRVRGEGFHQLHLEVAADADTRAENNALDAVTVASGAGRVLLLEDTAGESAGLARILASDGMQVETRPAISIPPDPGPLAEFDSLVLVDVPATSLTLDQQRTLQAFVRDQGRGLVAIGGAHGFGPGGYEGSVLDDVLPVSSAPPIQRQQGSVALFLVLDKSGSMDLYHAQDSKMAMAREAAIRATDLVQPDDTFGVIAFDSDFRWVVAPTHLRGPDELHDAQARIGAIQADGGTMIGPPLRAAYDAALKTDARFKHIVLLTDGQSFDTDHARLVESMRPSGVTLSTVAIGSDADATLLANLARLGDGRYYFTERSTEIPRIASREATILTRNTLVEGRTAVLAADPSPLLRGLGDALPALQGYVATTPRERAVTALVTPQGHPLLAHWQYGLGRAVAWTSDVQGRWTSDWQDWPDVGRFWAQAVRWTMPAPQRPALQAAATVDGQQVTLRAQSQRDDGGFADLLDTRATVVTPDGVAREVPLPQRGPGAYELTTEVDRPGVYRVVFSQRAANGPPREELAGFAIPSVPELRTVGADRALLARLAQRTHGRELVEPSDLLRGGPQAAASEERQPLWPYLAALALALLPLDVLLRRLRWSRPGRAR